MNDRIDRTPLCCDTILAGRIERAEVRFITAWNDATRRRRGERAGFAIPIAGGVVSYAGSDVRQTR